MQSVPAILSQGGRLTFRHPCLCAVQVFAAAFHSAAEMLWKLLDAEAAAKAAQEAAAATGMVHSATLMTNHAYAIGSEEDVVHFQMKVMASWARG